jgi:putative hemolysin
MARQVLPPEGEDPAGTVMLGELTVILLLIAANGLLSAAEVAILTVRKTRLHELASEGRGAARAVQQLRKRPERFFATVQVGMTVVTASAAAFGGASFAHDLAPALRTLGLGQAAADDLALLAVVLGVSFLSVVLGELVPKSLALRHAEGCALVFGRPVALLGSLFRPVVWLLTAASNAILWLFKDRTTFTEARLSRQEVRQLLEDATEAGEIDARTGDLATRALDFQRLPVATLLVARPQVVAVEKGTPLRALVETMLACRHQRIPVYDREPDRVLGHVTVWRALEALASGAAATAGDLAAPVEFVAKTTPAIDVLRGLQARGERLAVVLEESGGVAGMVCIEDLVGELVGSIPSERPSSGDGLRLESPDSAVVSGALHVRDVNRALDLELPELPDAITIGGLATKLAEGIPAEGTVVPTDHATLEVLEATPRRVERVRVRRGAAR